MKDLFFKEESEGRRKDLYSVRRLARNVWSPPSVPSLLIFLFSFTFLLHPVFQFAFY